MRRVVVLFAGLLVLSGCTAPMAGPTTENSTLQTRTPDEGPDSLPTNESRIYDRVATLLDSNVSQPSLQTTSASGNQVSYLGGRAGPFHRLLLDADDSKEGAPAAYYGQGAHRVTVILHDGVPAGAQNLPELEAILAHEYAHAVTLTSERYRDAMDLRGGTTDSAAVSRAMVEGSAVYVADTYGERYLTGPGQIEEMRGDYRAGSALGRYVRGPYLFGGRYFEKRLDSPANLTAVYRNPPETTEQLIHNYGPENEPPATLRVSVRETETVSAGQTDTTGELFVRDVLGGDLSESRAATAAEGWGNDRMVTLWNHGANESDQRNFVWALRWDDQQNATEFQRAFADYMDARSERIGENRWQTDGEQFGLQRVSNETVVVVIGSERIVEQTRVSGSEGNVSVRVATA
ncbi:hypothetical protein [Halorussus halophilus]|uniref:hypothetical protein n=1 Tax=Halorussus halophilus TaxID=2650975 RepID=UPI001300F860|nr:hypothetical protein [Halorussus halophilus]